ncbi:MAG: DUF5606 domain-containing protein [Prolixibacteraceae bacterium]
MKGILAISGHPGLSKLISEAKNCIIVESLVTGKRMPVYSTSKVSALADIAIFTESGEVTLKQVLKKVFEKENGEEVNVNDSGAGLKAWFEQVLPEYDRNKVYTSDMKKVAQWYNLLLKTGLLNLEEEEEKAEDKTEA